MDELLTVLDAARMLGVSCDAIRYYVKTEKLSALRTRSGMRLFRHEDVERFRAKRQTEAQGAVYVQVE